MDNSIKDSVLAASDIVAIIGERVALTRKGREYLGLCPFHPDHKPSLSVSPAKQIFKCWSCGVGGDVIRFVERFEHVDFRTALASLANRAGIQMNSSPVDHQAAQRRDQLLAILDWAAKRFQNNLEKTTAGQQANQYALDRGMTAETIAGFNLGYAPDAWNDLLHAGQQSRLNPELLQQAGLITTNEQGNTYDRFRNRLIFPITDALGRTVAFGGRTLGDDQAKYLNSPETALFSKSRILYGLKMARQAIQKQDAVIVVEGYLDAVLLAQFDFKNVVATLGTALTDAHAKLLRPLASTIYLCFDGDDAGVRAADRAVEVALRTQTTVRVVLLEDRQDPADCVLQSGNAGFASNLNAAVDALEFKWSQALNAIDQSDQRGRRSAIEDFVRFIAGIAVAGNLDPLQQDMLTGRLSDVLGVPSREVFDLLSTAKHTLRRRDARQTPEINSASAYNAEVRGLPAGLITAAETVLGLLLIDPARWQTVDDKVAQAMRHSQTWSNLYAVLLEVHQDVGEYSIEDVVTHCGDSVICELVGRVRARVLGLDSTLETMCAAKEKLAAEMDVLKWAQARDNLRQNGDDDDAFRAIVENTRGRRSALSTESHWSAASSP